MVSSAWAAEVIYTSNDIGKLIGSDGNVYAAANDVPSGVTVSGMIAYINTSDHWGLVISPVDLNYNGTEGSEKSTQSQAVGACSGYNRPRPLAAISSWRLPSQDDFNRMIGTDGCGSADNLRNLQGPNSVSCINNDKAVYGMKTDDGYWSSTETATTGVFSTYGEMTVVLLLLEMNIQNTFVPASLSPVRKSPTLTTAFRVRPLSVSAH